MSNSWVRALSVGERHYGLVGLLHRSTSRVTNPIPNIFKERGHLHSIAQSRHAIKIISGTSCNARFFSLTIIYDKVCQLCG
jgi:hypothetical protein